MGKFTIGTTEITPDINIVNSPVSLTEGTETHVTLKVNAVEGQYGEWQQTIKVKRLSSSDLPELTLKSLKVYGEEADLASMSVSVPNDKESISSENLNAEFLRLLIPISDINITVKDAPIQLEAGKITEVELSIPEKTGSDGYKAWKKTLHITRKPVPVTGVDISSESITIETGETKKLIASVQPPNATNKKIEWSSDNNTAASVDQEGTITANDAGTAKITVRTLDGNFEKTCTVTVIQKFSVNFAVDGSGGSLQVKAGGTQVTPNTKLEAGTVLEFKAIPEEGFEISNWEGISANPPTAATIQHTLTENLDVKVKFKQKTYKVTFEPNGGSPAPEPQTIIHGQKLTEPPKMTLAEKEFEGWYKDISFTSKWNFESDKVTENIKLYAKWDKIKITVKFDNNKIEAYLSLGNTPLANGEKVYIGDKIYLVAVNLEEGELPSWTINGKPSSLSSGIPYFYEYVVKEQDAENRIILFDYSIIQAEKLTIKYDNSIKRIFIPKNGEPEIPNGSKIDEGTLIAVEANLPTGKIIDKCLVNGKLVSGMFEMEMFIYKVSSTDADGSKTLNFSCTEKTPYTGTVHWDNYESPITCNKLNEHGQPAIPITNGEQVKEGDGLDFTVNLPEDQIVDTWAVNGVITQSLFSDKHNRFLLFVKAEHFKDGKLTIGYTVKGAATGTIQWDNTESPMTCNKQNPWTELTNGAQIQEGDSLNFTANLTQGKVVDKWVINGVETTSHSGDGPNRFWLNVKAKHLSGGTLTIGYTVKGAATGTIQWDNSNPMTCDKWNQHGPNTTITNGDQVHEGDSLNFYANPPQGQIVDKWTVNGVETTSHLGDGPNRFWLNIKAKHLSSGTLIIGYTTKGAASGTIHWNDSQSPMTCEKWNQYGPNTAITNGDQVQEGDSLNFYANPPQGQIVDKWMINGVETESNSGDGPNRFWLNIKAKHFKNGKITIGYTTKPALETKVNFDNSIRCSVTRNKTETEVKSNETIVYEGEHLNFRALGMPHSAVKSWEINNKNPQDWNWQEQTWFNFTVMKSHISQASSGTVSVGCKVKEGLKSAALTFDSGKIKCFQNGYSLDSGLRLYAGVQLNFEAILSGSEQVKSWKINGVEQANSGHKNFVYAVKDEDLNEDNFTVEIMLK